MKQILLHTPSGFTAYPLQKTLNCHGIHFLHRNNHVFYALENQTKDKQVRELPLYTKLNIADIQVELIEAEEIIYYRKNLTTLFMNNTSSSTFLMADYQLSIVNGKIRNPNKQAIYINGNLHTKTYLSYKLGDHLKIGQVVFIINENAITAYGNHQAYSTDLTPTNPNRHHLRNFPNYHRSPRIIHRITAEKIQLALPKEASKLSKGGLMAVIMTPLMSLGASIAMILIMNRGAFVYITIATTIITTIVAIMKYISDKKQIKAENAEKDEAYEQYLLRTRKKLEASRRYEKHALAYHHPPITNLAEQVRTYNSRIYEKDRVDEDFLQLCMGVTHDKSCLTITLKDDDIDLHKDARTIEIKQIKRKYSYLQQKPMTIDMKTAHIGLVGDSADIHEQLKQMLAQLTFFHSYHDVEIIMLYNERYEKTFDYVKWYPHMRISAINVRGNIYEEKIRDQLLASLTQILKQRKQVRDEGKKMGAFTPHYAIFIDDYSLVMNHGIMEYLQEETTELGFTLIFSAKQKADLLENIKTVILVEDLKTNRLLMADGKLIDKVLASPQIKDIDLETMARDLSVLNHQLGIQSRIPEAITFFDLYQVEKPEEFGILQRWQTNQSHKTLSVPLGVRGEDDIVYLDLHEKAHGPHGLIAGTTGSGKSEIIQSYILSLAVNFHPHEVGFLLIDYKGGGMANLFKNMPHLLGTITNLDGSESMRALVSIKSELKRRQKIFNDHEVNNIIKYNKLFKSGIAKEPLPSLFLISDEFGELKKEQPEFMSELVSVARIGRTLGIKLILATQKPSGIVDPQIWSNSKFKLALKVADIADSREVIKTPDAAYLTQAGRAILQIGNNEIYEAFQSAWSGATYTDEKQEKAAETFVYRINHIGQEELVNKDLSDGDDDGSNTVKETQLDVTINHIAEVHQSLQAAEVIKPWLPSLETQIVSPYFAQAAKDTSNYKQLALKIAIGIVDIPERQEQSEYHIDFLKDGNLAFIATSGFGKTFTIGLILLSLAMKNSPELLHYYIVDLGNSALIPFANLPHTADYMTFDANEKLLKLMKLIENEIKERKKRFAQAMVQNFDIYNQMNEKNPLKAILVVIDNYDIVKEMEVEFEQFTMRLSRDGASLGLYVLLTASATNAIKYSTFNHFKKRIAGYLHDKGDYTAVVGRLSHLLPEIKGRAAVKLEDVNTMQIYTPFAYEEPLEYIEKLKHYIGELKTHYTGQLPAKIPVLPDTFTSRQFNDYPQESPETTIKIGLCMNEVVSVDAGIHQSPYIIIGGSKTGKTNLLELYLNQLPITSPIYLFDSPTMELFTYKEQAHLTYLTAEDEIKAWVEHLFSEVRHRQAQFQTQIKTQAITPQSFYTTLPPYTVIIDGMTHFAKKVEKLKDFPELLKTACEVGISFIVTATPPEIKETSQVTKFLRTATSGVVLSDQGTSTIFPVASKKDYPTFGCGLLFNNGSYRTVLIPKYMKEAQKEHEEI